MYIFALILKINTAQKLENAYYVCKNTLSIENSIRNKQINIQSIK